MITVIMIPKAGNRDMEKSDNWRPISLLNCAGKLFEKIVERRMRRHLEGKRALPPEDPRDAYQDRSQS